MSISLMDSSLRDGGNINDWNFGVNTISGIIKDLVDSKIEFIELGYLRDCEYDNDKSLYNTVSEAKNNISEYGGVHEYSLMTQVDKWDWDKLEKCDGAIKNIRVSFHKTKIKQGIELCNKVSEYGYICHCNPINIMGYDDDELIALIKEFNNTKISVFTIVDTFGALSIDDFHRICCILNKNLRKDIKIAAHLHENLGLAFALAIELVNYFEGKRDIIIDASLYGMGRVPGNLCIELIANYLNNERGAQYRTDYLYDAIDDYISEIKLHNPWGYNPAYALSAIYNLHRTYPEYLLKKGKLKTKDIKSILERIDISKRVIYSEEYIEKLYREYIEQDIDDRQAKERLKEIIRGKDIVIIAPGQSITLTQNSLREIAFRENTVSISVNFLCDFIDTDIAFFTSPKRISRITRRAEKCKYVLTSNLIDYSVQDDILLSYYNATSYGQNNISEDGVLMVLHILSELDVNNIYIGGFDAIFGSNDHFDSSMNASNTVVDIEKTRELFQQFEHMKIHQVRPENEATERIM